MSSDAGHGCDAVPVHGGTGAAGAGAQHTVDLPGHVAFQAPHVISPRFALRCAPQDVSSGALVDPHTHHADQAQGAVRVSAAAPVETMPYHLAGGRLHGRHATQSMGRGSPWREEPRPAGSWLILLTLTATQNL